MATVTAAAPNLTDEQIQELLPLLGDADSVELKLTLPISAQRPAATALGVDPLDAIIREVTFFDTPDLMLTEHGIVVRARRTQGKPDDSTIKLRPVAPAELPKSLRTAESFVVEVDALPGGYVCSGSYKGVLPSGTLRTALLEGKPIRKLFSKEQRRFYAEHAPEGLALDDLRVLGPITVLKLNMVPAGFDRKLVGEIWLYPDGSRVVELSTKCKPSKAFDTAVRTRAFLNDRGIDVAPTEQRTKTKTALEFFASHLD